MLRLLHHLLPVVSTLSLLAGLALLGSLRYEMRQTQQLLRTLVAQDGQHLHLALEAQRNAIATIMHLHVQTVLMQAQSVSKPAPMRHDLKAFPVKTRNFVRWGYPRALDKTSALINLCF